MKLAIRLTAIALVALASFSGAAGAATRGSALTSPQSRAATNAEVRQLQKLGRVIVSPDGALVLFEWARPYEWVPDNRGVSRQAAIRPRTTLYQFITTSKRFLLPQTVDAMFPAKPGATYYLGTLSPDQTRASFYELDRDTNSLRAGCVTITDPWRKRVEDLGAAPITWLSMAPDGERLDRPAVWSGDGKSLLYPVKGGIARADSDTGNAALCGTCSQNMVPPARATEPDASGFDAKGLPKRAKRLALSQDGSTEVFSVSDADQLSLYVRRNGQLVTLFQNKRK